MATKEEIFDVGISSGDRVERKLIKAFLLKDVAESIDLYIDDVRDTSQLFVIKLITNEGAAHPRGWVYFRDSSFYRGLKRLIDHLKDRNTNGHSQHMSDARVQ